MPASHPVTCSQCKYEHDTAAAAATPGVYIRCRTRLSVHPNSSSSLFLLLHAFVPDPSTLHPAARSSNSSAVSLQEQIRRHTSFLSMPAESRGSAGLLRLRCSHLLRPRSGGKRSPTHNPSHLPSFPSLPACAPHAVSSGDGGRGRGRREGSLRGQTLALAREAGPRTHNDSSVTVTQEEGQGRGGGRRRRRGGHLSGGSSSSSCRPPPSQLHPSAPAAAGAFFLFFLLLFLNGSKVTAATCDRKYHK